ncbi:coronin [Anaeramoeba flamelloides]|uniref:Coronin n=1 Tax=Anaeramoeba flamelloides TaxID=1746091 RepID=A0ABQ8XFR3_9EUKA|nr:coronin [Anaeramoeba flamelloides]
MQVSKFRYVKGTVPKLTEKYLDLQCATQSCDFNMISAGLNHIAVHHQTQSNVLILPYTPGKVPTNTPYLSQNGAVTDMSFSHYNPNVLATGSDRSNIYLWDLPESGLEQPMSTAKVVLSGHKRRITSVKFHPTAANILLSGSYDRTAKIWDIEKGTDLLTSQAEAGDLTDLSWDWVGKRFAGHFRDKFLRIFDPRSGNGAIAKIPGHVGRKNARVIWLGDEEKILSTGFGRGTREVKIYDPRKTKKSIFTAVVDSGSSIIMPLYDPYSKILFLASKGDRSIKLYEIVKSIKQWQPLETYSDKSTGQFGLAIEPRAHLDVMKAEVLKVIRLNDKRQLEPISLKVPRRSYTNFASDLYPDNISTEPASSVEQWMNGEDNEPNYVSIKPKQALEQEQEQKEYKNRYKNQKSSYQLRKERELQQKKGITKNDELVKEDEDEKKELIFSPKALRAQSIVRKSLVRHTYIKFGKANEKITGIKVQPLSYPETNHIQANKKWVAFPWNTGVGGALAVLPRQEYVRCNSNIPLIHGHKKSITDFKFIPSNDDLIVSASEDCNIKIWELPENKIESNMDQAKGTLTGHRFKVLTINVNPVAHDVLMSTSADSMVKLWDINQQQEMISFNPFNEGITAAQWSIDGNKVALLNKNAKLTVLDPRDAKSTQVQAPCHQGLKGGRIVWLDEANHLLTVGFNKTSDREMKVYDLRKFEKPIKTTFIDHASSLLVPHWMPHTNVLLLAGKGDASLKYYEINLQDPKIIFPINVHKTMEPQLGICMLPFDTLDVKDVQIGNFLKLTKNSISHFSAKVTRQKLDYFQDDLFPETVWDTPNILQPNDWQQNVQPSLEKFNFQPEGMKKLSSAPIEKKFSNKYKHQQKQEYEEQVSRDQVFDKLYSQVTSINNENFDFEREGVDSDEWGDSSD